MARWKRIDYPMGSVSSATMRPEDLIPTFAAELVWRARHDKHVSSKTRRAHVKLVNEIYRRIEDEREFADDDLGIDGAADDDLDILFDALDAYSAPYFYFGSHPGDGSDYGYWLSESWDEDFESMKDGDIWRHGKLAPIYRDDVPDKIKVDDLSEVPSWFRGEVAVANDHGNVALYVKTSRGMREIWSVV